MGSVTVGPRLRGSATVGEQPEPIVPPPPPPPTPSVVPPSLSIRFQRVAAVTLSGHRVVTPRADGTVEYASNDDLDVATQPLWLTLGAAIAGEVVYVLALGEVEEPSWTWVPGPVYLGIDGVLTQDAPEAPEAAFILQVAGVSEEPTNLYFEPRSPITLTA